MLKLKFCTLKSLRKFLVYCSLYNSLPCKSNKCFRLGKYYISKHRKTCGHPTCCRVGPSAFSILIVKFLPRAPAAFLSAPAR